MKIMYHQSHYLITPSEVNYFVSIKFRRYIITLRKTIINNIRTHIMHFKYILQFVLESTPKSRQKGIITMAHKVNKQPNSENNQKHEIREGQ